MFVDGIVLELFFCFCLYIVATGYPYEQRPTEDG